MVLMALIMVVVGGTVTTSGEATPTTSLALLADLESNCRGPLSPEPGATGMRSFFCGILVTSFPVVGPLLIITHQGSFLSDHFYPLCPQACPHPPRTSCPHRALASTRWLCSRC